MSDESLISLIKAGDSHAQNFLLEKYSNLVNVKATKFFLVGGENDDIVQEGMIGLYMEKKIIHLKHLQIFVLKDS